MGLRLSGYVRKEKVYKIDVIKAGKRDKFNYCYKIVRFLGSGWGSPSRKKFNNSRITKATDVNFLQYEQNFFPQFLVQKFYSPGVQGVVT